MNPVRLAMHIPPTAPPKPPRPTTDATACFGNISEAVVKILQDHPWCAAAASPISATAGHSPLTFDANITGTTHNAQISMAVLRARLIVQPRLIKLDDNHPPPTLPKYAAT